MQYLSICIVLFGMEFALGANFMGSFDSLKAFAYWTRLIRPVLAFFAFFAFINVYVSEIGGF